MINWKGEDNVVTAAEAEVGWVSLADRGLADRGHCG